MMQFLALEYGYTHRKWKMKHNAILSTIQCSYRAHGSGVQLWTLNYDNPSSNPVLWSETLTMVFHSSFSSSRNSMDEYQAVDTRQWWICVFVHYLLDVSQRFSRWC